MLQLMGLEVSWQQWLQFQTDLSKKDTENFFSWQLMLQLRGFRSQLATNVAISDGFLQVRRNLAGN